jgi:hypothetical protein
MNPACTAIASVRSCIVCRQHVHPHVQRKMRTCVRRHIGVCHVRFGLCVARVHVCTCRCAAVARAMTSLMSQDPKKATRWYRKAAQGGQVYAQYQLGRCYAMGLGVARNLERASYWTAEAAERGLPTAQHVCVAVPSRTVRLYSCHPVPLPIFPAIIRMWRLFPLA